MSHMRGVSFPFFNRSVHPTSSTVQAPGRREESPTNQNGGTMFSMRMAALGAAMVVAVAGASGAQSAHPRREIRSDKREVRLDKRELRNDGREIASDRREIRQDVKAGDKQE